MALLLNNKIVHRRNRRMSWKFRYLIPEGTCLVKTSEGSSAEVEDVEVHRSTVRGCYNSMCERMRAHACAMSELSENRGEAITRDGKTTGSFRFDGNSSPSRCRST